MRQIETSRAAPPARELAYTHVKAFIATIGLRESRFLTEAEIADGLGVSRTPVREAFLRLEAEGLLRLLPQRGAFIPPLSPKDVGDLMQTREVIEAHCARTLVRERIDVSGELDAALADQRRVADDVEAFIGRDRAFHQTIVDAAGNDLLSQVYEGIRERQLRTGVRALLTSPRGRRQAAITIAEHDAIVRALRSGSQAEAEKAVRTHLRNTRAILARE